MILDIFAINSSSNKKKMIMFNEGKDLSNLRVKISRNFKNVIFTNKHESYLLSSSEDEEEETYSQSTMAWINKKLVREIIQAGDKDFLLVCCKEYDRDLDVQSSLYENFKISIKRRIEPNTIMVFDVIQKDEDEYGIGSRL